MGRREFQEAYTKALSDFILALPVERPSLAVQLGQRASAAGWSVSTIFDVHDGAVERMQLLNDGPADVVRSREAFLEQISTFFRASLAAYEAANAQLRRENVTLLQINDALELQASRIAQSLHDDASQLLTVAHIRLAKAEQKASPECVRSLIEIRKVFDRIEQQLRRFSHELHPAALEDFGLINAIEFLVQGIVERTGLNVRLEGFHGLYVAEPFDTVLYRFIQEALTNVVRHAHATNVTIRLQQTTKELACTVLDDGVGFHPGTCSSGMGISGMRQRMKAVGGHISLSSRPGSGAECSATIPLNRCMAAAV